MISKRKLSPKGKRTDSKNLIKFRDHFESLYTLYHKNSYLGLDPLICVHDFSEEPDLEIAGFLCSALAYGRVENIISSLRKIFSVIPEGPAQFALNTTFEEKKRRLSGFRHRFNDSVDTALLFETLGQIVKRSGSVEAAFIECVENGAPFEQRLIHFVKMIRLLAESLYGRKKGFEYLVPSPGDGSACKRLLLYMRWMVRARDGIDLGVWRKIPPSELIFPVDTHVAKIASFYGITKRKSVDWKMACQITDFFREFDPHDPVKYDFSLCRAGMVDFRKGAEN
ncbi:hypothetical protein CHISP_0638 [Chitinispirillum alkaliphilum]|nr:hypothetical protein CHISP_0638 [Chitinispirillum alkaliphilum]